MVKKMTTPKKKSNSSYKDAIKYTSQWWSSKAPNLDSSTANLWSRSVLLLTPAPCKKEGMSNHLDPMISRIKWIKCQSSTQTYHLGEIRITLEVMLWKSLQTAGSCLLTLKEKEQLSMITSEVVRMWKCVKYHKSIYEIVILWSYL